MLVYVFCYNLRQWGHVMTGVCLSVCLSVCHCISVSNFVKNNYWTNFQENFTTDVSVGNEELVKFRKSFAYGSECRNFWRILPHCEIKHLSQSDLYLRTEWSDFHENLITHVSLSLILLIAIVRAHCLNHLYTVKSTPPGAIRLRTRGHQFELPAIEYEFKKRNFIVQSLFHYV